MLRASSSSIVVVNRRRSSSLCLRAQPNQTPTHATRCLVAAALQTTEETGDATRAKPTTASQRAVRVCCCGACRGASVAAFVLASVCFCGAFGWLSAAVGRCRRWLSRRRSHGALCGSCAPARSLVRRCLRDDAARLKRSARRRAAASAPRQCCLRSRTRVVARRPRPVVDPTQRALERDERRHGASATTCGRARAHTGGRHASAHARRTTSTARQRVSADKNGGTLGCSRGCAATLTAIAIAESASRCADVDPRRCASANAFAVRPRSRARSVADAARLAQFRVDARPVACRARALYKNAATPTRMSDASAVSSGVCAALARAGARARARAARAGAVRGEVRGHRTALIRPTPALVACLRVPARAWLRNTQLPASTTERSTRRGSSGAGRVQVRAARAERPTS